MSRSLPIFRRIALASALCLALATPALAGGKGPTYANDLLRLIFNGTAIANIADNAASSPVTSLYVALHTADPTTTAGSGTVNTQNASEAAYASYARVAVARTSGGWTVSTNTVVPAAAINFPASTGSGSTITHWSVGTSSTGTGKLLYSGAVTPNIAVGASGITPSLTTSTTITEN